MSKPISIIAGEGAIQAVEAVFPLLDAAGDFDPLVVPGNDSAAETAANSAIEHAQAHGAVVLAGVTGPEESSTGEPSRVEAELRRVLDPQGVMQPLLFFNHEYYWARSQVGSTDLLLFRRLDNSPDGEGATPAEVRPAARMALELANRRAAWPRVGKRVDPFDTAFQVINMESGEGDEPVSDPPKSLWGQALEEAKSEYPIWVDGGNQYVPRVQLHHFPIRYSEDRLGVIYPHDYDLLVADSDPGNQLAQRTEIPPALLPSGLVNPDWQGIYKPARPEGSHSAPAILLSLAMALRYSLEMPKAADRMDTAVKVVLGHSVEFGGEDTSAEFAARAASYMKDI